MRIIQYPRARDHFESVPFTRSAATGSSAYADDDIRFSALSCRVCGASSIRVRAIASNRYRSVIPR
jgi:hypothetical protein